MDVLIITTIITSSATIVSAVIGISSKKKLRKQVEKNQQLQYTIEDPKNLYNEAAYSVGKLIREIVLNIDGTALVKCSWIDIHPNQGINNLKIPYVFYADSDNIEFSKLSVQETADSELSVGVETTDLPNKTSQIKELKGFFLIHGYCDTNTKHIGFSCNQNTKNAYLMSKEEVIQKYHNSDWSQEYCAAKITVPTSELILSITFPEEFRKMPAKPKPVAFLGNTHLVVEKETKKIEDSFIFDNNLKATLTVKNPYPWANYVISWMPPSKEITIIK